MGLQTVEMMKTMIDTAARRVKADVVLTNCRVFNVFTNELENAEVAIKDGYIAGVGKTLAVSGITYEGAEEIDLDGDIVCPGLIDGHIHIESSMMTPDEFARAVVPHGTTAVITDPHEIGNVAGTDGIGFMLECSENLPLDVFFMLPSCVPATPLDESGAELDAKALSGFYANPRVLGLAELMNSYGTIRNDESILEKIADAKANGRIIDGHAPGLSGAELNAYIVAGVSSDHECSTANEAIEKMKRGQWIMIREGTAAHNLKALLPLFGRKYYERCMLVTDDKHPGDLNSLGHIDYIIREAVKYGENAMNAVKMATYNPARYFGLTDMGAVAPGYRADIITVGSLENFVVRKVFKGGKLVAENGKMTDEDIRGSEKTGDDGAAGSRGVAGLEEKYGRVFHSFNLDELMPEDFAIKERGYSKRVIGLVKGELLTRELIVPISTGVPDDEEREEGSCAGTDPENGQASDGICGKPHNTEAYGVETARDIIKLAVVERHRNTGHIGLGYIYGYGLKCGAIASSIAHDSHNLIIAGTNDEDIALAANTVRKNEGGLAVVLDGKVVGELALPIGGIMCDESIEKLEKTLEELKAVSRRMGVPEGIDPFMTLGFVSLPVIPEIRLTTNGLVNVLTQEYVPAVF